MTFPSELSAVESIFTAFLVAKTSIMEVPKVTIVIAVTSSLNPTRHPNIFAKSLMTAARNPMKMRDTTKAGHP